MHGEHRERTERFRGIRASREQEREVRVHRAGRAEDVCVTLARNPADRAVLHPIAAVERHAFETRDDDFERRGLAVRLGARNHARPALDELRAVINRLVRVAPVVRLLRALVQELAQRPQILRAAVGVRGRDDDVRHRGYP